MAIEVRRRNGEVTVGGLPQWIVGLFPDTSGRAMAARRLAAAQGTILPQKAPLGSPLRPTVRELMLSEFGRWD